MVFFFPLVADRVPGLIVQFSFLFFSLLYLFLIPVHFVKIVTVECAFYEKLVGAIVY